MPTRIEVKHFAIVFVRIAWSAAYLVFGSVASAATFGSDDNQFTIDFVTISGSSNPTSGYGIVNYDYQMGVHEITNDQWNKFTAAYGEPTGSPSSAYDRGFYSWGTDTTDVPTNDVSWYEAAQFVNWLNTSTVPASGNGSVQRE